ncbi:tyrosine-protein phosphatase [soil metagenome]
MSLIAAPRNERRLPLEGAFNLRDFGGYATASGRMVKRGMLYRSGTMSLLTESDAAHLQSLGVRAICDFRRGHERNAEPTRWHGDTDVDYYCRDYAETSGILGAMLKNKMATAQDMTNAMLTMYREIAIDHAESYRAMFAQLASGRAPLLINCSVGKDRTGVGAALILSALGVPRATIVEDYLLTNRHADWDWLLARRDAPVSGALNLAREAMGPVLRAEAAYIDTLFATLDETHGGIDAYLKDVMGLDMAARARLCDLLLD